MLCPLRSPSTHETQTRNGKGNYKLAAPEGFSSFHLSFSIER